MSRIFYTSDTHFDHKSIIRLCNRPFNTCEQMNNVIIENWNSVVRKNDIVYHLGDFSLNKDWSDVVSKLNGHIHLIIGNHDERYLTRNQHLFESVKYADRIVDDGNKVWLSHYPLAERPRNTFAIYGHVHNNTDPDWPQFNYISSLADRDYYLNAGVDINNFIPVTLKQLILNNEEFRLLNYKQEDLYLS